MVGCAAVAGSRPARCPGEKGSRKLLARRRLLASPPAPARPTLPPNCLGGVRPTENDKGPLAWPWAVVSRQTLVGCHWCVSVAVFASPGWR